MQKTKFSPLEHYDTVGYIIVGISALSIFLLYRVSQIIVKKDKTITEVPEEVVLNESF